MKLFVSAVALLVLASQGHVFHGMDERHTSGRVSSWWIVLASASVKVPCESSRSAMRGDIEFLRQLGA